MTSEGMIEITDPIFSSVKNINWEDNDSYIDQSLRKKMKILERDIQSYMGSIKPKVAFKADTRENDEDLFKELKTLRLSKLISTKKSKDSNFFNQTKINSIVKN